MSNFFQPRKFRIALQGGENLALAYALNNAADRVLCQGRKQPMVLLLAYEYGKRVATKLFRRSTNGSPRLRPLHLDIFELAAVYQLLVEWPPDDVFGTLAWGKIHQVAQDLDQLVHLPKPRVAPAG